MVVIRLSRSGAHKRPYYHIVVTDRRSRRDGRFIDRLGFSNPMAASHEEAIRFDLERFAAWRSKGAQPSATVLRLYRHAKRKLAQATGEKAQPSP